MIVGVWTAVTPKDYVQWSPEITGLQWRSVSVRRGRAWWRSGSAVL